MRSSTSPAVSTFCELSVNAMFHPCDGAQPSQDHIVLGSNTPSGYVACAADYRKTMFTQQSAKEGRCCRKGTTAGNTDCNVWLIAVYTCK
jgi:hypothetical protein